MKVIACCGTDIGLSRKNNQDAVSIKKQTVGGIEYYMAVVCDGVGGLSRGEYASRCMKERLERWFFFEFPQIIGQRQEDDVILQRLYRQIEAQNEILYKYGKERGIRCATTVSALVLTPEKFFAAHVGDSRIYKIKSGVEQITDDQSLLAEVNRRNVILQSVGAEPKVEICLYQGKADEDVTYLVCTDGFYHCVSQKELENWGKSRFENLEALGSCLEKQIYLIKERGERDNISAAILQIQKKEERTI